jgi:hypothetical protein
MSYKDETLDKCSSMIVMLIENSVFECINHFFEESFEKVKSSNVKFPTQESRWLQVLENFRSALLQKCEMMTFIESLVEKSLRRIIETDSSTCNQIKNLLISCAKNYDSVNVYTNQGRMSNSALSIHQQSIGSILKHMLKTSYTIIIQKYIREPVILLTREESNNGGFIFDAKILLKQIQEELMNCIYKECDELVHGTSQISGLSSSSSSSLLANPMSSSSIFDNNANYMNSYNNGMNNDVLNLDMDFNSKMNNNNSNVNGSVFDSHYTNNMNTKESDVNILIQRMSSIESKLLQLKSSSLNVDNNFEIYNQMQENFKTRDSRLQRIIENLQEQHNDYKEKVQEDFNKIAALVKGWASYIMQEIKSNNIPPSSSTATPTPAAVTAGVLLPSQYHNNNNEAVPNTMSHYNYNNDNNNNQLNSSLFSNLYNNNNTNQATSSSPSFFQFPQQSSPPVNINNPPSQPLSYYNNNQNQNQNTFGYMNNNNNNNNFVQQQQQQQQQYIPSSSLFNNNNASILPFNNMKTNNMMDPYGNNVNNNNNTLANTLNSAYDNSTFNQNSFTNSLFGQ